MSQHRHAAGSLSVKELVGHTAAIPRRHRAEPPVTGRMRALTGAAVAAGTLLSTTGLLAPAIAQAAPHTEAPGDAAENEPADIAVEAPAVEPVAALTPFGLTGLPVEIAGPLAQAEQAIKDIQKQLPQAPQLPEVTAPAPATPVFQQAPAVLPVAGVISSGFGSRWGEFHYGVDIADPIGTPIHSALGGTVLEAGPASGFGQWIRVQQDDGTIAVYGHVNDMYVSAGERVNAGDVIASVGSRGNSTGPHLHLEIWDESGTKIDPVSWLAAKGILMEQHWGAD
ncbi:M23 family metallopeptidase [Nocardia inohanensis]|uniref:M23 family metallopeptidase n=1 Tax=Nocardia inohanensis TaxID=209246 RepID=UPI000829ADC8|nr:M23 family metallopeptidase [Nocardia inohanensis]